LVHSANLQKEIERINDAITWFIWSPDSNYSVNKTYRPKMKSERAEQPLTKGEYPYLRSQTLSWTTKDMGQISKLERVTLIGTADQTQTQSTFTNNPEFKVNDLYHLTISPQPLTSGQSKWEKNFNVDFSHYPQFKRITNRKINFLPRRSRMLAQVKILEDSSERCANQRRANVVWLIPEVL